MARSLINWTKDDKRALQMAVNNFNAKVRRLEKMELGYDLPSKVSVSQYTKGLNEETILSRAQLRNVINSLKRFTRRGVEKPVRMDNGEVVSYYEKHEIDLLKSRASRELNRQISKLEDGFGMGNAEKQRLLATRKSLLRISEKRGEEFKSTLKSLKFNANANKEIILASRYIKNYIYSLETMVSSFENVDKLISKIKSFKNPVLAYEFISQSEVLKDIFNYYQGRGEVQTYGGFDNDQEAFDYGLEQVGIL